MVGYRQVWRSMRLSLALAGAGLVCGCAGAVHQLPQISKDELNLARAEVQRTDGPAPRHAVTKDEAAARLGSVLRRIGPSAQQLCQEMGTGVCRWNVRLSGSGAMNAHAAANGQIVIYRGIFETAENDEELAMVVAHEMGHQAADHMARTRRNQIAGRVIGAVLLGVAGGLASRGSRDSALITQTAASVGGDIGGAIGRISFSKEQEREADYLSAVILYRAGVDLDKARGFQVKMAMESGKTETGILDGHPAGPERIAAWDQAVQQVRASNGRLPSRQ
jgi:predicted Zn-dependent protease